jgi:hypothetical protein
MPSRDATHEYAWSSDCESVAEGDAPGDKLMPTERFATGSFEDDCFVGTRALKSLAGALAGRLTSECLLVLLKSFEVSLRSIEATTFDTAEPSRVVDPEVVALGFGTENAGAARLAPTWCASEAAMMLVGGTVDALEMIDFGVFEKEEEQVFVRGKTFVLAAEACFGAGAGFVVLKVAAIGGDAILGKLCKLAAGSIDTGPCALLEAVAEGVILAFFFAGSER